MTERGWKLLVAAAAWIVVIAGLRSASALVVPLLVSIFLAIVSFPVVSWLQRRHVPTGLAVLAAMLAMGAVVLGPGVIVHRAALQFAAAAPRYRADFQKVLVFWLVWLEGLGVDITEWAPMLDSGALLDLIGSMLTGVAALLSNAFLVLLTMAFILMEAANIPEKLRRALSVDPQRFEQLNRIGREVQTYLWIKSFVSLGTGLAIGLWAGAVGLEFAALWGLLAFLLNYIPNFGSFLAAVPALLFALVQLDPTGVALLALGYLLVNTVLGNVVEPYWMGRRLRMSPLVILLSLIFWAWMWGAVGMLLAVPIMMVIKIVLENSPGLKWMALLLEDIRPSSAAVQPSPSVGRPSSA